MAPVNNLLFKLRDFFSSTTFVCFIETLWTIGCSVVAGVIPAYNITYNRFMKVYDSRNLAIPKSLHFLGRI